MGRMTLFTYDIESYNPSTIGQSYIRRVRSCTSIPLPHTHTYGTFLRRKIALLRSSRLNKFPELVQVGSGRTLPVQSLKAVPSALYLCCTPPVLEGHHKDKKEGAYPLNKFTNVLSELIC